MANRKQEAIEIIEEKLLIPYDKHNVVIGAKALYNRLASLIRGEFPADRVSETIGKKACLVLKDYKIGPLNMSILKSVLTLCMRRIWYNENWQGQEPREGDKTVEMQNWVVSSKGNCHEFYRDGCHIFHIETPGDTASMIFNALIAAEFYPESNLPGGDSILEQDKPIKTVTGVADDDIFGPPETVVRQGSPRKEVCQTCRGTRKVSDYNAISDGSRPQPVKDCPDCNNALEQKKPGTCQKCGGSGASIPPLPFPCPNCDGTGDERRSGEERRQERALEGWVRSRDGDGGMGYVYCIGMGSWKHDHRTPPGRRKAEHPRTTPDVRR